MAREKECITKQEYNNILEGIKKKTKVYTVKHTSTFIPTGKTLYYYSLDLDKFPTFPQFISDVHFKYGRMVDIAVEYVDDSKITLFIRGYSKELCK